MRPKDTFEESSSQELELTRVLGSLASAGNVVGGQADSLARRAARGEAITRRELSQLVMAFFSVSLAGDELVELTIDSHDGKPA